MNLAIKMLHSVTVLKGLAHRKSIIYIHLEGITGAPLLVVNSMTIVLTTSDFGGIIAYIH